MRYLILVLLFSGCGMQFRPDTRWDLINENVREMNGQVRRPNNWNPYDTTSQPSQDMSPYVGTPSISYNPVVKSQPCRIVYYQVIGGPLEQRFVCN
jgi:hypothetical protein